ncbi:MAG TPA: pyridoxamine 5'-phosphate oxidase family protein [Ktedonobacteraceae bacterium]|jgi:PPOX class probable F420-dependent enzyme
MSTQHPDSSTSGRVRVPYHREVPFQLPDLSTPVGQNIARCLHASPFVWLTTVDEARVPHSLPLGFIWDEAQSTLLIYSMAEGDRDHIRHMRQNPKVGVHFDFDMNGGDPVVLTGEVSFSTNDPPSDQVPVWVEKYEKVFSHMGMTMQQAAALAPVALRIHPLTMLVSTWTMQ